MWDYGFTGSDCSLWQTWSHGGDFVSPACRISGCNLHIITAGGFLSPPREENPSPLKYPRLFGQTALSCLPPVSGDKGHGWWALLAPAQALCPQWWRWLFEGKIMKKPCQWWILLLSSGLQPYGKTSFLFFFFFKSLRTCCSKMQSENLSSLYSCKKGIFRWKRKYPSVKLMIKSEEPTWLSPGGIAQLFQ